MTQNPGLRAWRASFVRRWHTHPDLAASGDTNAGHQQRTALLVLHLHPDPSREMLIEALTHDQGEVGPGDVSGPAKRRNPDLATMVAFYEAEEIREQGIRETGLPDPEKRFVTMCDRLDAYLWMLHHNMRLAKRMDWHKSKVAILEMSHEFGSPVMGKVERILAAAEA